MKCIFLRGKKESCEIYDVYAAKGRSIKVDRDEAHKKKYCRKGNFLKCPVYQAAKEDPLLCVGVAECHHHPYYPHILCIERHR